MAKEFLPLFLDFNETTQDLDDAQCGRLVRALVEYANGKDPELSGTELIAFRFLKGSIDRNAKLSAVRAEAGSKGGKQAQANASKNKQTEATESKSNQNAINNDNDINKNTDSNSKQLLADDEASKIRQEHDRIYLAAEDAGFKMSNTVRARLVNLYAEHGLDKMLSGFDECVYHGATNLAYLEAVLKGTGKKPEKKSVKTVVAQDYEQRDYSNVQDEIERRQKERFAARLGRVV